MSSLKFRFLSLVVIAAGISGAGFSSAKAAPLSLTADDGVVVHGEYDSTPNPKALILLFHQAGSSKSEYKDIAPRLARAGYSTLAIDQRAGGGLFGPNETAEQLGRPASYLEARRDLEAALAWGEKQGVPVMLWGSSYSAALVFVVAAAHPQSVKAVMAFSPGEYFTPRIMIREAASHVTAPIYVTSSADNTEVDAARSILSAAPAHLKVQYLPREGGVHGSSTLLTDHNPLGAESNWRAVLDFLSRAS